MSSIEFRNPWSAVAEVLGDEMNNLVLVYDHQTSDFVPERKDRIDDPKSRPTAKCKTCGLFHYNDFIPPGETEALGNNDVFRIWSMRALPYTETMLNWGEKFYHPKTTAQKPVCPMCHARMNSGMGANTLCADKSHAAKGYRRFRSGRSEYTGCPKCVANAFRQHNAKPGSKNVRKPNLGTFGSPTSRFPRAIGFEIETGSIGDSSNSSICNALASGPLSCRHITNHHDGSLDAGGIEYVTPALLGDEVESCLGFLYKELRNRKLSIEHVLAGAHIHVDARDLFYRLLQPCNLTFRKMMRAKSGDERNRIAEESTAYTDALFDAYKDYFRKALMVCRIFISERRRTNTYCRESFGIRNTGKPWLQSRDYPGNGYCGIAVRTDTLEFRIWPSTNSMKNHIARAELSCKIVEFLAKAPTKKWRQLADEAPDGRKAVKTASYYNTIVVPWLAEIGVSHESIVDLNKMAEKYRNGKNDKDPTTVRDQVMKEIPDPEALDKLCEAIKKNTRYKDHLANQKTPEQVLAHPHTTFGDTMAWVPELGVYFDLETFEAVPNVGSGGYRYRM